MQKTFFLQFSFLYLSYSLGGYNKNKTRPWRPRIQLGKWVEFRVGAFAIPSETLFLSENTETSSNHQNNVEPDKPSYCIPTYFYAFMLHFSP
jgi:hypothetical protein